MEAHHVRCIVGSARHLTHEPATDLYLRLGISPVRDFLCASVARRITQISAQALKYPGQNNEEKWLKSVLLRLQDPASQPQRTNTKPSHPQLHQFKCLQCDQIFDTLHGMRTHMASKHGTRQTSVAAPADFRKHSVDGLPICVHCGQSFRKWGGFKGHLNACPVLRSKLAQPLKPVPDPVEQQQQINAAPTSSTEATRASELAGSNALASGPVATGATDFPVDSMPFCQQNVKLALCQSDLVSFAEKEGPHQVNIVWFVANGVRSQQA